MTIRRTAWAVFRFLNLHEPDTPHAILSLSKLSVWTTLGLTVFVVLTGQGMMEVGAALVANTGSIANYAYRRSQQVRTGTGGYREASDFEPFTTPEKATN